MKTLKRCTINMAIVARRIRVSGVVQGVGFRPFIYRIATRRDLKGYVSNLGGSEAEIWIEGDSRSIQLFMKDLLNHKPPPARLDDVIVEDVEPRGYGRFEIRKSRRAIEIYSMIPPDFGMCDDCLREILDPRSRWYKYPFNSCAWCGPRFSMMYTIPYDRENTAMRDFPLCSKCLEDYSDPNNIRRFHAQGISCPKCGPRVYLVNKDGELIDVHDPIRETARIIDEGYIVAVKGLGGFHIAALATDDAVVLELRERKRRPQKPFALMALNIEIVKEISNPTSQHIRYLKSIERPIVLIPKKEGSIISSHIAPGLDTIGIMLAYTPLHYLLLLETRDKVLIMTSGNPPGLPIVKENEEALRKLSNIADYFLLHNRVIVNRVDDSVMRLTDGKPTFLRRSRGFVPYWFKLPFKLRERIMALGAMLNNTGAIGFKNYVIPTQYVGDADNLENIDFLVTALEYLSKNYSFSPEIIVSDLHPSYTTTLLAEKIASELKARHVKVQHHHAHIAATMATNSLGLESQVLGIAIDGVGYGLDRQVWGGEALITSYTDFERIAHLQYLPLPGGDLATRRPARIIIGYLAEKYGVNEAVKISRKLCLQERLPLGEKELKISAQIATKSPKASSIGRFLDAISALLGICWLRTYEGEPAMKLEAAARGGNLVSGVRMEFEEKNGIAIVLTGDFLESIMEKLGREPIRDLAYTTQYLVGRTLVEAALSSCEHRVIALGGGAAVNNYIVKGIRDGAGRNRLILLPENLPPGDGGISLGQVVIAGSID